MTNKKPSEKTFQRNGQISHGGIFAAEFKSVTDTDLLSVRTKVLTVSFPRKDDAAPVPVKWGNEVEALGAFLKKHVAAKGKAAK
jgi:hypothetical protein